MEKLVNYFEAHSAIQKVLFFILAAICLTPFVSAPLSLGLGFLMANVFGNPYEYGSKKVISLLLQASIVGLGFGMNLTRAVTAGKEAAGFTILSIISLLVIGYFLTKLFKIDKVTGYLIAAGTAICGGSAIAALTPIVKAKPNQTSIALAVIFTLNSIALLAFPLLGIYLNLSQQEFGLWCAIAIHDTSSVVGAASSYGAEALEIATTVKLARALWIIPLSLFSTIAFKNKESRIKIPWFIGLFLGAIYLNTYYPMIQPFSEVLVNVSKLLLTLTLFLIGAGISIKFIKTTGLKPFMVAILLWVFISVSSLLVILRF